MELKELEQTWAALGDVDPFWAVLSDPRYKYGRWDVEEFYRTGDEEVEEALGHLVQMGHKPQPGRCLEFGCGVGRCSNGLSKWFERYDGVDISEPMLALARHYHDDERLHYHHNTRDDLSIFEDATFDLVYSLLVLQHIPPPHALGYVSEFMRVLKPGGIALFQLPAGPKTFDEAMFAAHLELESAPKSKSAPAVEDAMRVRVRNDSPVTWPADSVLVGNHWLSRWGSSVRWDDGRATVPGSLAPGEEVSVDLRIMSPRRPGAYVLEVDALVEGVAWFANKGSHVVRTPVVLEGGGSVLGRIPAALPILADLRRLAPREGPLADGLHAAARLKRRLLERAAKPAASPEEGGVGRDAPSYGSYAVSKQDVVSLVERLGGAVAEAVEDGRCGGGWTSYLYTVVKAP